MIYLTRIIAIDSDGELSEFAGPRIEAISFGMAEKYCQENKLNYCQVLGEFIGELPCDSNSEPDISKLNYTNFHSN